MDMINPTAVINSRMRTESESLDEKKPADTLDPNNFISGRYTRDSHSREGQRRSKESDLEAEFKSKG